MQATILKSSGNKTDSFMKRIEKSLFLPEGREVLVLRWNTMPAGTKNHFSVYLSVRFSKGAFVD